MTHGRRRRRLLLALAGLALCARPASGHVVDEYVQASYITLGSDGVSIDLNLTPGVDVAARVLAMIDGDGDGEISAAEGRAYAALVLRDLSLVVDGRQVPLSLAGGAFPAVAAVRAGEGVIRLRLSAAPWSGGSGARPGAHTLALTNSHHPAPSTYLVNAYLPAAPFTITGQRRDRLQRAIEVEFTVAAVPRALAPPPAPAGARVAWRWVAVALVTLVAGASWVVRRRVASR